MDEPGESEGLTSGAETGPRTVESLMSKSVPARGAVALRLIAIGAACLASAACAGGGGAGAPRQGPPGEASVEWAGLRYRVALLPSPGDRIRLRAEVTNISARYREEELPWCLIRARLHRDGRVVYDRAGTEGCAEGLRLVRLRSGESEAFQTTLSATRVLGDSLAPGRFEVSVRLPRARELGPPRAEMELRLGTVTLERSDGSG